MQRNDIVISPTPVRGDREIADEVRAELARNIRIDPSKVTVDVVDGVVHLKGSVPTIEQKVLADEVAWRTAGVRAVADELRVVP